MKIDELRIYAECLEQGLDFKDYLLEIDNSLLIRNIYLPKFKNEPLETDSALLKILKLKSFDLVISIISSDGEIPILLVEYSTAVPTDDHKMQRSDVYFWSGIFKIPVMKISPLSKNSFGKHGGGDKIGNDDEFLLALSNNAIVYFIDFPHRNNVLLASKQRLSCIAKNDVIKDVLSRLIEKVKCYEDFAKLYEDLLHSLRKSAGNIESLKNVFVNSTRFSIEGADIVVKINRFGHAMDPDRGILFFINMLFGSEHTIAKFIIERERQNGGDGYKALFDGLSKEKLAIINNLILQGITTQNALEIFTIATGINVIFHEVSPTHFSINDENFFAFLRCYTSNVYKSIF